MNRSGKSNNSKFIIAAVSVIIVVIVIAASFLITKMPLYKSKVAKKAAADGKSEMTVYSDSDYPVEQTGTTAVYLRENTSEPYESGETAASSAGTELSSSGSVSGAFSSQSAGSASNASSGQSSKSGVNSTSGHPAKTSDNTSATNSSSKASVNSSSAPKTTAKASTTTKKSAASSYPYAYAGFNPVTTDMSVPIERLLLNRSYKLPDGYVPPLAEAVSGSGVYLHKEVAPHYKAMYNAAARDGIYLTPVSGYRSYERQKNNFENQIRTYQNQGMDKVTATKKAAEIRLLPGTSEHNAGLAMDICSLSTSFDQTKEFRWLQAHAHEYGFIMRYPKNKTNVTKITYEPWHYRYVGVDIARQLKSSGQVLEEYLGKSA